jgi:hypothetical protein
MLATVIPLFHHVLEEASSHIASEHVVELKRLLRGVKPTAYFVAGQPQAAQADGVLRYWALWCSLCKGLADRDPYCCTCDECEWDVGVIDMEFKRYSGGCDHLLITGGRLPSRNPVCPQIARIDACAKALVRDLLTAGSQPASLGKYRGEVKHLFMEANLSHMMPPSIRTARI